MPKPDIPTAGQAVLEMRDHFIELGKCYLAMRRYDSAQDCIRIAASLEKFEDDHDITNVVWPPQLKADEDEPTGQRFLLDEDPEALA